MGDLVCDFADVWPFFFIHTQTVDWSKVWLQVDAADFRLPGRSY